MSFIISIILGLAKVLLKVMIKAILFTGAWAVIINYIPVYKLLTTDSTMPFADRFFLLLMSPSFLLMAYITIQNLVRLITQDPDFKLIVFAHGKSMEKKATDPTIKELYGESGVMFGESKGKLLVKPETQDGHVLVIGGAGSGKSSCVAIPTLNRWHESAFVIDIKGELKAKSDRPNKVNVFNPTDLTSLSYDPFYMLHESENLAQDVKDITLAIMPTPPNVKDPFWIESAQNVLTASLIYHFKNGYSFISAVTRTASSSIKELINKIYESDDDLAKIFIAQLVDAKDETISGIGTELMNKIMLFATDTQIMNALDPHTNRCISPQMLENGEDIFICIPEHKIEQWRSLLTLMCNQFLKHFEKRSEIDSKPILFLLDEFARLGKIQTILNGLATLRSKKITIAILTQSLAQLDLIYGKESRQVICDNCNYKAILKATDADTQEYFSKLVGTYEKTKKSSSANFEQYTSLGKGTGMSKTTEEKRIIKPEQFATLDRIVLLTPWGFCRATKKPYYLEKK